MCAVLEPFGLTRLQIRCLRAISIGPAFGLYNFNQFLQCTTAPYSRTHAFIGNAGVRSFVPAHPRRSANVERSELPVQSHRRRRYDEQGLVASTAAPGSAQPALFPIQSD